MSSKGVKAEDGPQEMVPQVTSIRTQAEASLAEQFAARLARLPGSRRVAALRSQSLESFLARGLPNRRVEAWHYTDLRRVLGEALPQFDPDPACSGASANRVELLRVGAVPLILVDGVFRPDLSGSLQGLRVRSLADALAEGRADLIEALAASKQSSDPTVALNAAFMDRGVMIEVAEGAQIEKPVELIWTAGEARAQAIFARSLVWLGRGSRLTLIERASEARQERQINAAMVVKLDDDAHLDHVRTADRQPASLRIETFLATLGRDARLTSTTFAAGAPFFRRQTQVRFDGERAKAALCGLSLLRGTEHVDNTILIEHIAPSCESREKFKHVVEGEATGVFQGRIVVAPGAQKTDGVMASRTILLSENASMYNKPELEIFADDVVCGHGATCGELDADQLFYAMTRGLPRADAEALLLEAFASEALENVNDEILREALCEHVRAWLAQRGS